MGPESAPGADRGCARNSGGSRWIPGVSTTCGVAMPRRVFTAWGVGSRPPERGGPLHQISLMRGLAWSVGGHAGGQPGDDAGPPLILSSRSRMATWLSPDHGVLRCQGPPDHPPSPPASSNDSSSASMSPGDPWVPLSRPPAPPGSNACLRYEPAIMLPKTDEVAVNLPPGLCLLGVAVVPRGMIPSSCSPGSAGLAVLPCRPNNQGCSSHQWDLPDKRGGGGTPVYARAQKSQGPEKTSLGSIGSRKQPIRSIDGAAPITNGGEYLFTSSNSVDPSRAGENWFNMLPPTSPGTSQTTKRLYKLSSPDFQFNPVNISPAVAKLNGIKIWKQSPYPVGELQERRFPGTTRVPTNSSE